MTNDIVQSKIVGDGDIVTKANIYEALTSQAGRGLQPRP